MGRKLFHDGEEVSQVVGATLVVAISVVLAVSTAAFVFGVGNGTDSTAPEVDFTYRYSQVGHGNLTIVHDSGDGLDPGTVEVRADMQFRPGPGNASGTLRHSAVESYDLDGPAAGSDWVGSRVEPGEGFTIVGDTSSLKNGTVRIVWVDAADGRTTVLGEWQGPNA